VMGEDPIRILIADDHTLLRAALAQLLRAEGFEVVAAAGNAQQTVELSAQHQPDVLLLDIEMPGNEHPEVTVRAVQRAAPDVQILVLTMHDDPILLQALLPLGIRGFLHKTITHQALGATVRDTRSPDSPPVVSLASSSIVETSPAEQGALSPRETEVIELAAHGRSNYQIGRALGIAEGTVKRHMRSSFDKLDARSRVEAANKAVQLGLIRPPVLTPNRRPQVSAGGIGRTSVTPTMPVPGVGHPLAGGVKAP